MFGPEKDPKTLKKRGPNPLKIDAENVLLFNIDFFGFWSRFWSLLVPKMESSWLQKWIFSLLTAPFAPSENHLKLDVFKNDVLEGSGFDFGGPGLRFWSLQASIF